MTSLKEGWERKWVSGFPSLLGCCLRGSLRTVRGQHSWTVWRWPRTKKSSQQVVCRSQQLPLDPASPSMDPPASSGMPPQLVPADPWYSHLCTSMDGACTHGSQQLAQICAADSTLRLGESIQSWDCSFRQEGVQGSFYLSSQHLHAQWVAPGVDRRCTIFRHLLQEGGR